MSLVRPLLALFALVAGAASVRAQATVPTTSAAVPAQSLAAGAGPVVLDLRAHFALPGVAGQVAQITTSLGRINLELLANDAPRTVENFLRYATSGRYQNTFVHRAVTGFVVQGGGYTAAVPYAHIETYPAVVNEFKVPNTRGTVAMAKLGGDPNSATSEWFFNLADNRANLDAQNGGFTVFARVIGNGMNVVDGIAALGRYNIGFDATGSAPSTPLRNVPAGETQLRAEYYVLVSDVKVVPIFPPAGGGASVLAFSATSSSADVVTAAVDGASLTLTPQRAGSATVTVTATDSNGANATQTIAVTVAGSGGSLGPVFAVQPQAQLRLSVPSPQTVVLSAFATGTPAPTYQWKRNGVALAGQTGSSLVIGNANPAVAGSFTCVATNAGGSVESTPSVLSFATVPAAETGRLVNLAIRTNAGTGAQTLIVGFSLGGAGTGGTTPLLIRGVGPSLTQFGLTGVLADPAATLLRGEATVGSNDNWGGAAAISGRAAQVGAFPLASAGSLDAALALAPEAGSYTVQITGRNGGTGIALAEIYDAAPAATFTAATPRLVNVSARTEAGQGADMIFAGFAIGGTTARTVLIRAIGPTLAVFGVTETLANPVLRLLSGENVIGDNDDWGGDPLLAALGASVGAFAIPNPASRDAVLVATLPPGSYTVQVSGANGGTGVALVELYELP
jgi:hypothetical protein